MWPFQNPPLFGVPVAGFTPYLDSIAIICFPIHHLNALSLLISFGYSIKTIGCERKKMFSFWEKSIWFFQPILSYITNATRPLKRLYNNKIYQIKNIDVKFSVKQRTNSVADIQHMGVLKWWQ